MKRSPFSLVMIFTVVILITSLQVILTAKQISAQETVELKPVVVTATRIAENPLDVPQNVTVINQKEIEESGAKNIADLLDRQAGIQVSDYGPEGAQKTLSLRGSTSAQVLVLIDGVRVNNSQSGGVDLSLIPLDNVERIEIVRGGNSSLYGADAVGGVINIITKKSDQKKFLIKIRNGSYIPQKYVTGYGTAKKYNNANLLSLVDTQKITLGYFPKLKNIKFSNIFSFTRADNGYFALDNNYENRKRENADLLSGNFSSSIFIPFKNSSLNLKGSGLINKKGVPGSLKSPSPLAEQEDRIIDSSLKYKSNNFISELFDLDITSYYQYKYLHYYNPSPSYSSTPENSTHKINRFGVDLVQNFFGFSTTLPVYGLNINYDKLTSTDIGTKDRLHAGLFMEINTDLSPRLSIIPSIRYDYYSDFSDSLNMSLGSIFRLGNDSSFKIYASKAYRVPTFNDMYWPETNFVSGNPDLKPETGYSVEAGYIKNSGHQLLSVTVFARYIEDVILWLEGSDSKWRPSNYGEAFYPGLELQLSQNITDSINIDINYTYIYSFTLSGDYKLSSNKRVPYIPVHKIFSSFNYKLKHLTFSIQEEYTGKRFTGTSNEDYLNSYFITNLTFSDKISDQSELNIFIHNIFNELYQIEPSYPMPGTFITVEYKLKL